MSDEGTRKGKWECTHTLDQGHSELTVQVSLTRLELGRASWGGFLEKEVLVEAKEVRPAVEVWRVL